MKILPGLGILGILGTSPVLANSHGTNISLLGGPGFELTNDRETLLITEVSTAYIFPNNIELGLEFGKHGAVPIIGLDANYYFPSGIFAGAQFGMDFDAGSATTFFGPQIGFDFQVSPNLCIGPEIQVLTSIGHYSTIFETLVTVKYFLF